MTDFCDENEYKLERTVSTKSHNIDRTTNTKSMSSKTESTIVQKFSYVDWNTIEQILQPNDMNVLTMLSNYMLYLIETKDNIKCDDILLNYINKTNIKYKIIGDEIYIHYIRNKIDNVLKLTTINQTTKQEKQDKKTKKRGVTKEGVIFNNLEQSIIKFINILSTKKTKSNITNIIPTNIIQLNILEYIGITFMFQLNDCINILRKKFDIEIYKVSLSIFISMKLYINNCTNIFGSHYLYPDKTINISSTLINDMNFIINEYNLLTVTNENDVIIKCGSINDIYKYTPHLLIQCDHLNIIPGTQLKPRVSQSDTMKTFIDNFDEGVLIISKAMIGSGKTTLIVPIANYVQYKRKTSDNNKMQLIFCCNILSVKLQAATLCFNMGIPFGMAHVTVEYFDEQNNITTDISKAKYKQNVVKIINNFNCKHDNNRIVIIGSPDAIELLFQSSNNYIENYILFIDEPTIGLDSTTMINSPLMLSNVNLLMNLPKRSILSSATMPYLHTNSMQNIINSVKQNNKNIHIEMIIGDEMFIGCNVETYVGNTITPHNNCSTFTHLSQNIEFVKTNPFMGRMYTYDIFKLLIDKSQLYDLMNVFNDIKYINANSIKKQSLTLLTTLNDNNLIQQCCEKMKSNNNLNINKIGTHEAYKFPNMTLIAVENDIINTTISMFKDLLNILPDYILMMNQYDNDIIKYDENKLKQEELRKKTINKKSKNHDDEKLSKIDIDRELNDNIGESPNIRFPNFGKINSIEHLKIFKNDNTIKPRLSFILEDIDYNFNVIDDVKLLLMCGVGIYSPSSFDDKYTNEVIRLASKGSLAFVISDYDICYGTNYPFNTVIITDDFAYHHSLNTLFQLMGRAGRVGRSWTANAIVPNDLYDIFIDYMKNPDKYDIEEKNLYKLMNN
tara:strand:- start:10626 stop:13328 length:2703 start_codon:yes stop_codon:yes gene_type:complete